jgi:membrane peptidoglycan carboxypeptidase
MRDKAKIYLAAADSDASKFIFHYSDDAPIIIKALLAAEDHRAQFHRGIDIVSLARSVLFVISRSRICGVSTIEQQYVRTIFKRSDAIWKCKLRELWIVITARRFARKDAIWLGYPWRAYYGHGLNGYKDVRALFCENAQTLDLSSACQIVACLKYPRPRLGPLPWSIRHRRRASYIEALVKNGRRRSQFLPNIWRRRGLELRTDLRPEHS